MTRAWLAGLLVASCGLGACTYRVRESNVVIARIAPAVDMAALQAALPDHTLTTSPVATPDG
ncbi:MAG TPA: hypothetical protein VLK29_07635, partial [Luteimonas sp.]|nr:hypothetical protein [Luteimonas sp.]